MPTGKRPPKGAKPGLSQPKMPQSDRLLIRDFSRWLHRQPEIAAPTPEDESGLFTELLKAARHQGINLRTPGGVEELVTLLVASDDSTESDGVNAALATLHEYVHFRAETSTDPSGWDAIHDIFDDAGHGTDWLGAVIEASEQLAPQVRLSALTATLLVGSVSKLLGWIGAGRTVAPSGGVRRVDIAEASGLLGIDAVGVDKLPPYAPDMPALFEIESAPRHTALKVRSMLDVPLLPSWWVALIASEIIEVKGSRVRPGPAAATLPRPRVRRSDRTARNLRGRPPPPRSGAAPKALPDRPPAPPPPRR